MRESHYGLLAVPPLLSSSSGGDLVHGDNIMVFPHTLDAYLAAQKMLLPAQGDKSPLPTVGNLQDKLAAFLHQQAFQYNGAVSGHGLMVIGYVGGGSGCFGTFSIQSMKTFSRWQARKWGCGPSAARIGRMAWRQLLIRPVMLSLSLA
jgi:hypothetical protein